MVTSNKLKSDRYHCSDDFHSGIELYDAWVLDFRQPARLSAEGVQVVRHQRAVRCGELGAGTAEQRQRRPGLHPADAQHGRRRQHRRQRRILLYAFQLYLRSKNTKK